VKEALASLGLCRREVRPPSRPLPESERAEVATVDEGGRAVDGGEHLKDLSGAGHETVYPAPRRS
ncbi:hypothetical protein ACWDUG_29885, partial [Streptomyces cellulosae]